MNARPVAGVGVALVTGFVLAGAAPAFAVCDAYSGTCTTPAASPASVAPRAVIPVQNNSVTPVSGTPVSGTSAPSSAKTLPFTGGELVLMTAIGAGALAGGAALVVAGRRKSAPTTD